MGDNNSIFIGLKPFMNYVTAVVMQFTTKDASEVIIKARGKYISRAVDVAEVSLRRFLKDQVKQSEVKIGSEEFENLQKNCVPLEIINPGAIDFIRRCTKNEEAIEILDYLLKRNEISSDDYNKLKNEIMKDGGLRNLIEKYGGPKNSGYYIDKYYKKNITNHKFKSNKD